MARSARTGGKKGAAKKRKAGSAKGRKPKSQAQKTQTVDPQQLIAELRRELEKASSELAARNTAYTERIAYQAAANDVLKVMSTSPGDPQPVFDLISGSCPRPLQRLRRDGLRVRRLAAALAGGNRRQ
jgi:hypothetical protein